MSYQQPAWTPEQLAQRVEDLRAIQNVMGKQTFLMCYKRWSDLWETLWCKQAPEPSLTLNEGKYVGYDAIRSYLVDYQEALVKQADAVMRKKYPELEGNTPEETWGVGSNSVMNNDTCVLELAGDGQTAKGIWYSKGELTEVTDDGPAAIGPLYAQVAAERGIAVQALATQVWENWEHIADGDRALSV